MVFVSLGAEVFRNKLVARDAEHGVEDARVGDAAGAELGVEHLLRGGHEEAMVSDQFSVVSSALGSAFMAGLGPWL